MEPVMTTMIASTVQGFYAWRVARLTRRAWMGWVIAFLAFLQLGVGITTTIWASFLHDFSRFQEVKSLVIAWLGLSALTDILITYALTGYLLTHRTGFPRTDDIITRVVRMTVQTGLLTTLWTTINLILYLALPNNNLDLVFQFPLCKLYTNTFLSMLNARKGWDGSFASINHSGESTAHSGSNSQQKPGSSWAWRSEQSKQPNPTIVQIVTTTHTGDEFELNEYAAKDIKSTGAGDIESCAGSGEVTGVRFPSAKSKGEPSDATSIVHSRPSSETT